MVSCFEKCVLQPNQLSSTNPAQVNGINRSLQTMISYIAESFSKMSNGIRISRASERVEENDLDVRAVYFHLTSLRGDWKFIRQCCNLNRHASADFICYYCRAGKGKHPEYNYTDLTESARWKDTVFKSPPPYSVPHALTRYRFWVDKMIGLDILHIWHLGVGRNVRLDPFLRPQVLFCFLLCVKFVESLERR